MAHRRYREFFRIKAADDIRAILTTKDVNGLRGRKIKRFSKVTFPTIERLINLMIG